MVSQDGRTQTTPVGVGEGREKQQMEQEYLTTYTAKINSDPFWGCAIKGCPISFPHDVGLTKEREWKHIYADDYYPESASRQEGRNG